ncbi:phosphatidate cytidylyltransferase [Candidatus Kinetoplastibacterium oncopeltii TCC290E]|uniref:Phosphatidate cytidylyltransferase n=1 Tax=Candidatus Kinetoplastidibacterium stringomonadis TCC290E TaxID=1208920 RepID=M1LYW2_9PROT|nr:phosphatidate cytidylyltransferase [Candidatus Kinetoplastibacterium oncopeltii]AGF48324.1 phosphatidate cytidylyltransferase [Candidatus Kinetoplastibacterium oncopeltii TCC290E]
MLKHRVLTAIMLVSVFALSLLSRYEGSFIVLLSVIISFVLWEWLLMSVPAYVSKKNCMLLPILLFMIATLSLPFVSINIVFKYSNILYKAILIIDVIWLLLSLISVSYARVFSNAERLFISIFSIFLCSSVWFIIVFYYISYGSWFIISMLIFICAVDISGYFVGKSIGKKKLACEISPNKTIAGAVSGICASFIWFYVSSFIEGSFSSILIDKWSLFLALLFSIILSFLAIFGDLFESLLKRNSGIKDSSNLLPGHGGVYDRFDAIISVVPTAFLLSEVSF